MTDTQFWDFGISGGSLFLALLLLSGVLAFSFLIMKRGSWSRSLITVESVRILAASLMVFTLLRPERVTLQQIDENPLIAILIDESGSMASQDLIDGEGKTITRSAWIDKQKSRAFWKPLEEKYQVAVEGFGSAAQDGTDLNAALAGAERKYKDLRAVLLITDGDWNEGEPPVSAATRLRVRDVPVFAVGVGSKDYLPDLALESVSAPAYGLLDEQISIPYTVRSRLERDVKLQVSLTGSDGTEVIRTISVPAMSLAQESIVLTPGFEGDYNYTLQIETLREEAVKDNNQQSFQMNLRRELLKVLVVESTPRWEYRFLHNALSRDPGVSADFLLMHPGMSVGGGKNYLKQFPETRDELSVYDVIFVGDVGLGSGGLTTNQCAMIKGLVEQQGSGLVFLPGIRGAQAELVESELGGLNPVIVDPDHPKGHGFGNASRLVLTSRGADHLLTLLGAPGRQNQDLWSNLPGFYWHAGVLRARAESTVLAVHATARSRHGRVPLLATRNCGNGKSLFLGTDGAWRWRRGVEDTYHYRFWGQVVRWMAHQRHLAHNEGMRFFFSPEAPSKGNDVFLHATVFDRSGFPLEAGTVTASIELPSGQEEQIELEPETGGWGVFTGDMNVREGGEYQITLRSKEAEREVSTKLFVAAPVREVVGRPARRQTLREISEITRGQLAERDKLDDVVQNLSILPDRKPVEVRFRLWSHPLWAGLIAGLLAIYWSCRKWLGLI